MIQSPLNFILVKPAGADCPIRCDYCFYLEKGKLYPSAQPHRMEAETLTRLTQQAIEASNGPLTFGWQGGEPTLMGLPFFQQAIELQRQWAGSRQVSNTFQTNGLLLDRKWARFFCQQRILVGLSIDGPQALHDSHRQDGLGAGTFDRVSAALDLLQSEGVETNALVCVHDRSVSEVDTLYSFLKESGLTYMQFIPIVEWDASHPGRIRPLSVTPRAYGDFLCRLFDLWTADFIDTTPTTSIRWFESLFFTYLGFEAPQCTSQPSCGGHLVVEHNGDVYPCDFYVEPRWLLGNVHSSPLTELHAVHARVRFAQQKRAYSPACSRCRWLKSCYGGCPRERNSRDLSYLCPAYTQFFRHADARLKRMAKAWKQRH